VAFAVAAKRPDAVSAIVLEDPPSAAFWKNLDATSYHPTFVAMQQLASQANLSTAGIASQRRDVAMKPADGARGVADFCWSNCATR
jgi:hypothetical protein